MAEKFQNKYRIPSARASWWDYSKFGANFVTICTRDRSHSFGKILRRDDACIVSTTQIGKYAQQYWAEDSFFIDK